MPEQQNYLFVLELLSKPFYSGYLNMTELILLLVMECPEEYLLMALQAFKCATIFSAPKHKIYIGLRIYELVHP